MHEHRMTSDEELKMVTTNGSCSMDLKIYKDKVATA